MFLSSVPINKYGTLLQQCVAKKYYPTRGKAKEWARRYQDIYGRTYRPYRCKVCTRWHLTGDRTEDV